MEDKVSIRDACNTGSNPVSRHHMKQSPEKDAKDKALNDIDMALWQLFDDTKTLIRTMRNGTVKMALQNDIIEIERCCDAASDIFDRPEKR